MDHPIRAVAAALLAGVVAGRTASFPPLLGAVAGIVVAGAILAAAAGISRASPHRMPRRTALTAAVLALSLAAGFVIGTPHRAPPPPPSAEVAWIEGVVRTAPPRDLPPMAERSARPAPRDREDDAPSGDISGRAAVEDRDEAADHDPHTGASAEPQDVTFDLRLPSGVIARVMLSVHSAAEIPDLLPGDGARILGRVRPRSAPSNPGAVVTADPAGPITRVDVDAAGPESVIRVPQPFGAGDAVRRLGERLRRTLVSRIRAACGNGPGANLLVCALTGDRTTLPRDVARAFRDSGTAHLLAVSGLHLVLLTSVLGALGRRAVPEQVARRFAVPATLVVVLAFCAACRFETPVVRAAAFVVTRAVAHAVRRRSDPVDQLAVAAVLVVAWEPVQVFDPGFQLSFVAVAGLILLTRRIREALFPDLALMLKFRTTIPQRRLRWRTWIASAIPATAAAQCATAPVVAATFGTAQPAGFVANLFAVPAFAVLLPLAAALAGLGPHAAFLATPSDLAARAIVAALEAVAALPGATLALGRPPPWSLLLSAALLATSIGFRTWTRRHLVLPAASFVVLAVPALLRPERTEVIVLDVGHGLCVLVRSADGGAVLYDAGGRATGIGDRVIVPALRELGVRRLDALFLSHEDSDHVLGAEDVLRAFAVGDVVVPAGFGGSPLGRGVRETCREQGITVTSLVRGDRWSARGLAATALSPADTHRLGAENADSLVVRLVAGAGSDAISVLLTGDIEGVPLDTLVAEADEPTDVLILPHHGRAAFDAQGLLADRCGARVLIASASDDESRLPRSSWATSERGAIRVRPGRPPEAWPWRVDE